MASKNKLSNEQKLKLLLASSITGVLGLALLYLATIDKPIDEEYKPVYEYGGDFVLQNHTGDVALKDYRGKVVVLYFGFLNCTEACPISIGTIYNAIGKLSPAEREKLQVFFISVDPERDDIAALKAFSNFYVDLFKDTSNPTVLSAITGTRENIDAVSKLYGVYFDLVDLEGSGLGYTVDHSSRFYMIGVDGKLVTTMNHSTTPTELAAKIKLLQQAS